MGSEIPRKVLWGRCPRDGAIIFADLIGKLDVFTGRLREVRFPLAAIESNVNESFGSASMFLKRGRFGCAFPLDKTICNGLHRGHRRLVQSGVTGDFMADPFTSFPQRVTQVL